MIRSRGGQGLFITPTEEGVKSFNFGEIPKTGLLNRGSGGARVNNERPDIVAEQNQKSDFAYFGEVIDSKMQGIANKIQDDIITNYGNSPQAIAQWRQDDAKKGSNSLLVNLQKVKSESIQLDAANDELKQTYDKVGSYEKELPSQNRLALVPDKSGRLLPVINPRVNKGGDGDYISYDIPTRADYVQGLKQELKLNRVQGEYGPEYKVGGFNPKLNKDIDGKYLSEMQSLNQDAQKSMIDNEETFRNIRIGQDGKIINGGAINTATDALAYLQTTLKGNDRRAVVAAADNMWKFVSEDAKADITEKMWSDYQKGYNPALEINPKNLEKDEKEEAEKNLHVMNKYVTYGPDAMTNDDYYRIDKLTERYALSRANDMKDIYTKQDIQQNLQKTFDIGGAQEGKAPTPVSNFEEAALNPDAMNPYSQKVDNNVLIWDPITQRKKMVSLGGESIMTYRIPGSTAKWDQELGIAGRKKQGLQPQDVGFWGNTVVMPSTGQVLNLAGTDNAIMSFTDDRGFMVGHERNGVSLTDKPLLGSDGKVQPVAYVTAKIRINKDDFDKKMFYVQGQESKPTVQKFNPNDWVQTKDKASLLESALAGGSMPYAPSFNPTITGNSTKVATGLSGEYRNKNTGDIISVNKYNDFKRNGKEIIYKKLDVMTPIRGSELRDSEQHMQDLGIVGSSSDGETALPNGDYSGNYIIMEVRAENQGGFQYDTRARTATAFTAQVEQGGMDATAEKRAADRAALEATSK